MTETQPRPPAVTMACLFVGLGSLMMLVELFGALSNWTSLQVQGELRKALRSTELPGLSMQQALHWFQIGAYVALALCVAGTVFAFFTARGDRVSRIALTVLCGLAALAFLSGGIVGLLPAVVAMLSASALWSPEARAWFSARPFVRPLESAGVAPTAGPAATAFPNWMPSEVVSGAVVAMICSLLAGLVVASNALAVLVRRLAPEDFEKLVGKGPLLVESLFNITSTPTTDAIVIAVSAGLSLFALAGFGLSLMVLLGRSWARRPLVVLCYISIVLTALAFPFGLVLTAAAFATAMLLNRPAARRWR
jgi:hypothetical protein